MPFSKLILLNLIKKGIAHYLFAILAISARFSMKEVINSFFRLSALRNIMKTQYALIFSFLILNQVKRCDSYSLFTMLTYIHGALRSTRTLMESYKNIISIIFQSHVSFIAKQFKVKPRKH